MEMDSKLQLSDLRTNDVVGAAHHPIKIESVGIDVEAQPEQKELASTVVDANALETFDVECTGSGEVKNAKIDVDTLHHSSDSDFNENTVLVSADITKVELTEQTIIEYKPDPPMSVLDEELNASTCSIDIGDESIDKVISTENITSSMDDKAAPDPPEFSNVIFDADSSIVRLDHYVEADDATETTPILRKELDPPEYSNVIFNADASVSRFHFEEHGESKEATSLKKKDPDPPECTTSLVPTYDSSASNSNLEQITETPTVEINEGDTTTAQNVESDTNEFPVDLPHSRMLSAVEEEVEVSEAILMESNTVEMSISNEVIAATLVDQTDVAVPEQVDPLELNVGKHGDVELSSDVEQNLDSLPKPATTETTIEQLKISVLEQSIPTQSESAAQVEEKSKEMTEATLPLDSETNPAATKVNLTVTCSEVVWGNERNGTPATGLEAPSIDIQIAPPKEKLIVTGSFLEPTTKSSNIGDTNNVVVSACPPSQVLQSSFATMDDDDCSYVEIVVDDDDEFIEYVDEIEDDFTEVTCESENGVDSNFMTSNNTSFNGNSSNMDDLGCKRPVIKSATQKALENEVALKTAEAEEVMENMRFSLARQNSFCRKDDEYRKQLEMEEAEHLRQEEEEESMRAAELQRQARFNADKPCFAQPAEGEIRQQELEAEARRVAAEETAQEKAAAEKLRRDVEEREKMERDAKRKAMEEEVRLLQTKLAEAKIAAELAKKKQMEEKMRLKAKVDAHRREKRRTSITDVAPGTIDAVSTITTEVSTESVSNMEIVAPRTETVPPPPSRAAAPINTNTMYYSVEVLRQQSIPGLDYKNREIYIHPDEFQKLFQMSIAEFNEQPKWKRTNLKRKLKLF